MALAFHGAPKQKPHECHLATANEIAADLPTAVLQGPNRLRSETTFMVLHEVGSGDTQPSLVLILL
jgi:hypothetical protein